MTNKAFSHALHSLTHPIILGAVALLLVNDHVLRVESPSWLTGKLGDFAWLAFAPIICALVVAWLVPRRLPQQERVVGLISFGFIAAWFALAKTVPAVHAVTITVLDAIVGWHGTLGLDATDLLTLPALLLGWYVWTQPQVKRVRHAPFAWVVLALGVMSTVANSFPTPDGGISMLCQDGGLLGASTGRLTFMSTDGGLSWQEDTSNQVQSSCFASRRFAGHSYQPGIPWLLNHGTRSYRIVPGDGIYSYELDQVEVKSFDISEIGGELRSFYDRRNSGSDRCCDANFTGPFDAEIDEQTGNLVVAMGLDSILVQTRNRLWRWVPVGPYYFRNLGQLQVFEFILPEVLTGALLLVILPPTLSLRVRKQDKPYIVTLVIGWLSWFAAFSLHASNSPFATLCMLLCLTLALILNAPVVATMTSDAERRLPIAMIVVSSIMAAALFALPYALWVRGTLPNYAMASLFALLCAYGAFMVGGVNVRRYRFSPKKKKPDELITMVFRDKVEAPKAEAEGE